MGLILKTVKVEDIHAEFDAAESKILEKVDMLLGEIQEKTSHHSKEDIKRKANMLKGLGFVKAEPVKILGEIEMTEEVASHIRGLKNWYPLDKFITVDELNRICKKYKLVYAPVENYIKDVPEKNVLEMHNRKRLMPMHAEVNRTIFSYSGSFRSDSTRKERQMLRKGVDITDMNFRGWGLTNGAVSRAVFGRNICNYDMIDRSLTTVRREGLFIAAPKSHFDLKDLKSIGKFGFFSVQIQEIKDPVVFEYCKNDIVRIVTKWGTDDDQSYLDPALINETLN